jgi:site-specific DNA-methyltransferase (adenine-specific)
VTLVPYWQDAIVTVYHGDCLDLLPALGRVDHVITDPPYEAEAHTKARRVARNPVEGGGIAEDYTIDFGAIDERTRNEAARSFAVRARRWILVFCQAEAIGAWRTALVENGARWVRGQAWVKPDASPQFTGDRPAQGWEAIATAHGLDARLAWNGGGRRGVYTHLVNGGNHSQREGTHPTEKPLPLMREIVRLFTDPNETILDPFAGSGTTGLAARLEGRRAILIEREERYCELIAKRLEHMPREKPNGQRALFGGAE